MHGVIAVVLVLAASVASTVGIWFVYRADQGRSPRRPVLAGIFVWFVVTYAIMAFAVDPDL